MEKSTSIIAEHIRALNGIGFDWGTSKTDLESIWNERLGQLPEFNAQFGHSLVKQEYPSSVDGLRSSAKTIGCTKKESKVL